MATRKKTARKKRKFYKSYAHGTVYSTFRGQLGGYPMLRKGGYDRKGSFIVEESPKKDKQTHSRIAKKLGITKTALKKQRIQYY
tara:strand:+ start:63 stop:314 length:252 start_codon:yes stop_codon:yes gene_type:complete